MVGHPNSFCIFITILSFIYAASCRQGAVLTFTYKIPFSIFSHFVTEAKAGSTMDGHLCKMAYSLQILKYPFWESTSSRIVPIF